MAVTVEYMVILRQAGSVCSTPTGLKKHLEADEDIVFNEKRVRYKNADTCGYLLTTGEIPEKSQRTFHVIFTWNGDLNSPSDDPKSFSDFLLAFRHSVSRLKAEVETLCDDFSSFYARKAYPLVQDIENLMRRLIANFMLGRVGVEWIEESVSPAVTKALSTSKRKPNSDDEPAKSKGKEYLNVLCTLDFIHLGNILFDAYLQKPLDDLYGKIKAAKTTADIEELKELIPKSNWNRYFSKLINCQDGYLETRWKKLYDIRCKVAHNAPMTCRDLDDLKLLIGEVRPHLVEALEKLGSVTVPLSEMEGVAESAARNLSTAVGDFIKTWQFLQGHIEMAMQARGVSQTHHKPLIENDLLKLGILDRRRASLYGEIRRLRNQLVHGKTTDVPVTEIQFAINAITTLMKRVESDTYFDFIRQMSQEELESEIDWLVADSINEILNSEEFGDATADANAYDWDVHHYEVQSIEWNHNEYVVSIDFEASGDQDEEKARFGDTVTGSIRAVLKTDGEFEFEEIHAQLVDPYEEDEPDIYVDEPEDEPDE